ncbi:MAG: hypothetical protein WB625_22300 [Candidatus Sulfotelmatobacter sp.]|jgi:hypothetical protein
MISGRIGYELAVLGVLSVLTIFLFPAVQGPYCVMHGPATAFQAARAAASLRTAIMSAALNSRGSFPIPLLLVHAWISLSNAEFQSVSLPEYNTILRC